MSEPSQTGVGTGQLVLGTVQLGLPYGRRRHDPPLSQSDAEAILDHAWSAGIRSYDTAETYGTSPARVASWLASRGHAAQAHVVTKVRLANDASDVPAAIAAVDRFRGCRSVLLFTHGFVPAETWSGFVGHPALRGVPLGQSVYDASEVDALLQMEGVMRAQVPGSIVDTRAVAARGSSRLPLDVRSVFLQGLLLETAAGAEGRVPGSGALVTAIDAVARRFGAYPRPALLVSAFLRRLSPVDRIVVGVDAPGELDEILSALVVPEDVAIAFDDDVQGRLTSVAPSILDPRRWT